MNSLVSLGLNAYEQYANLFTNQVKAAVGETPQEKRHQPSFLTSLVSNAIKDWNAYNDCKDREESVNPSKPNTVETWVNEGLNAYAKYVKKVDGSRRKKGPSFIEENLYEKQSAKQPSPLISLVNQGLASYTNYVQKVQNINADPKERQETIKFSPSSSKPKSRLPSLRQGLSNYKKYAKKVWNSSIQGFGTNSIDRQFGLTVGPLLAFAAMAVISGTAFGIQTTMDEEKRDNRNFNTERTVTCSITVQGIPLASASDDPNPTATCYFYDLTNDDGKTAAIVDVPIGTTMGVSPVTYPVGTQIRVEAVYTSDKTPFNAKVEHQQFVTTDLVVPLNFDGDDFPESVLAPAGSGDPLFGG